MAVLSPVVVPPFRPVDEVRQTAVGGSSTTGEAGRSSVTTPQTGIASALSGVPRERGPYPPSSARRRPRNSMVGPPPASSTSGGSEQWCRRGGGHPAKSRGPRANDQPRCSPTCGPRHRHRRLWPMSCTSRFACLSGSRTRPWRRRRICNTNCRGRGSQRQCSARRPRCSRLSITARARQHHRRRRSTSRPLRGSARSPLRLPTSSRQYQLCSPLGRRGWSHRARITTPAA